MMAKPTPVRFRLAAAGAVLVAALTAAGAVQAQQNWEAVRRHGFHTISATFKQMTGLRDQPQHYPELARDAGELARTAAGIPTWFPKGTSARDGIDTQAADAVWTDRAGFTALAGQLQTKAEALAKLTPDAKPSLVAAEIRDLGRVCQSCHSHYRN